MMKRYSRLLAVCLMMLASALATAQTTQYEYWFDDFEPSKVQSGTLTGDLSVTEIEITPPQSLSDGYHKLSMRVMQPWGTYSSVMTKIFYNKRHPDAQPTHIEYWLEGRRREAKTIKARDLGNGRYAIEGVMDFGNVMPGNYRLNFRVADPYGYNYGGQHSRLIAIRPAISEQKEQYRPTTARIVIDDSKPMTYTITDEMWTSGNTFELELDVNEFVQKKGEQTGAEDSVENAETATLKLMTADVTGEQSNVAEGKFLHGGSVVKDKDGFCFRLVDEADKHYAVLCTYIGNATNVVIPWKVQTGKMGHPYVVRRIGDRVFHKWGANITSVEIPATITHIGAEAFSGCDKISQVICKAPTPPVITEDAFPRTARFRLFVPTSSLQSYHDDNVWRQQMNAVDNIYAHRGFGGFFHAPQKVNGLTADGVSAVFLPCTLRAGDTPRVSVREGYSFNTATKYSPTLEYQDKSSLGMSGIVLTAPVDFGVEGCTAPYYTLNVSLGNTFLNEGTKDEVCCEGDNFDVKVYRPGVIMVHGLNSNDGCFAVFDDYLQKQLTYMDFMTYRVNYKGTNKSAFQTNYENKTIYKACENLYAQYMDPQRLIVSSAYDLVGHSMGGILSRQFGEGNVGVVDGDTPAKNKEHIHKLITVNTPHWGSPIGDLATTTVGLLALADGVGPMLIGLGFDFGCQAVENLAIGSDATKGLSQTAGNLKGVPVHAYTSYIVEDPSVTMGSAYSSVKDSDYGFWKKNWEAIKMTAGYFSDNVYTSVFMSDLSDGVVGQTSQRSGMVGPNVTIRNSTYSKYEDPYGFNTGAHHVSVTDWDVTMNDLHGLLKASVDDYRFGKEGFSPKDPKYTAINQVINKAAKKVPALTAPANDSTYVSLKAGFIEVGDSTLVTLKVSHSADVTYNMVMAQLGEQYSICESEKDQYTFMLPQIFAGDYMFYVLGCTDNMELVIDSALVSLQETSPVTSLKLDDVAPTLFVGATTTLRAQAKWANGLTGYVTPEYEISDQSVLAVENGMLKGVGEGTAVLGVSYGGHADYTMVKVLKAETPADGPNTDLDGDGVFSISDITYIIEQYLNMDGDAAPNPKFDLNHDGTFSIDDITFCIDAYLNMQ